MDWLKVLPSEATKSSSEQQKQIFEAIKQDSTLPIHIEAKGKAKKPSLFRKIVLTGVTGHLGPYILQQFSQQESLTNIFCLVRASSVEKAEERVINSLKETSLLEKTNVRKICYILGDVAQPNLGLDQNAYNYLANSIDAVVHNAVYSNHIKSYPISTGNKDRSKCPLRSVNVTGVKNILEFAASGQTKHVLHSSSMVSMNRFDLTDGRAEQLPEKDNLGDGIRNGYCYSKFVGEKLMRTAMFERGIPATVIRYPGIVGDSTTGFMADLDNISCLILSMWSCGFYPSINFGMALVPVDTCALITKKLFFNDEASTGAYNLFPGLPTKIDDIYEVAVQNGITPIRKSTYGEYMDRILNDDDQSNISITAFKSIYSKHWGLKELLHSNPTTEFLWHDPAKLCGLSPKLERYVPGYMKMIPSPQNCVQNLFNFYNNSGRLTQLGVNTVGSLRSGRSVTKAAFLSLFCLVRSDFIVKEM